MTHRAVHLDGPALTRVEGEGAMHVEVRDGVVDERERLWARWREIDKNLDAYAARRSSETAVVVLEPRLES